MNSAAAALAKLLTCVEIAYLQEMCRRRHHLLFLYCFAGFIILLASFFVIFYILCPNNTHTHNQNLTQSIVGVIFKGGRSWRFSWEKKEKHDQNKKVAGIMFNKEKER